MSLSSEGNTAEEPLQGPVNPLGWVPLALVVWLVIFGSYEILERTVLRGAHSDLIHALHILRGTGTSFLLAALAAWYILQRQEAPTPPLAPGLKAIVADSDAEHLGQHVRWIIKLRWIAIVCVVLTALVAHLVFAAISSASLLALVLIALTMAGYNTLFQRLSPRELSRNGNAYTQVFLDLVALTLMIHFTGGIHNPFSLFYIFHIVIAGILLTRSQTYLVSAAACLLFCTVVLTQETGLLASYPLVQAVGVAAPMHESRGWLFVAGSLIAFTTTVACTAYFATRIMETVRGHTVQLVEANDILSQERGKLEVVARSVGAAMLILDPEGRILWANETAQGLFGDGVQGQQCFQQLWQADSPCAECPKGSEEGWAAPRMGERTILVNGKLRHFLVSCSQIRSVSGEVEQVLALIQDMTAVKEMEIRLRQAGKMVAVGQLATGIAHEFGNPLAIVSSSTEILADYAETGPLNGGGEVLRRHLAKIDQSVYRCKGIIDDLLGFARCEVEEFEQVRLRELLDETIALARESPRGTQCEIVRDYAVDSRSLISSEFDRHPVTYQLRTRPRELQQVLLNLIVNALDATPPAGKITISAEEQGGRIVISVADTGEGISPEHRDRIFEPFFTTKPIGQGTGLGLYLSHQLLEALGGTLSVDSGPGEGTVFRVALPLDQTDDAPLARAFTAPGYTSA